MYLLKPKNTLVYFILQQSKNAKDYLKRITLIMFLKLTKSLFKCNPCKGKNLKHTLEV